jgi:hypothetical protein
MSYCCIGIYVCPIGILAGGVVFLLTSAIGREVITKRYGSHRSGIVTPLAVILGLVAAYAVFHLLFAPAFPGYYHPKRRPRDEDIVGTWIITEGTREFMDELGYSQADPTLIFHNTGEFSAKDFPDTLFHDHNRILYTGEGKWKVIRSFQGHWQVELTFNRMDPPWFPDPPLSGPTPCPGLSVPCEGLRYTFDMWNRKPPYYIFAYIRGNLGPNIYYERLGDIHEGSS